MIYFASKYNNISPVEKRIEEELLKRFHVQEVWQIDDRTRRRAEEEIAATHGAEFARLRQETDYHDRSWTVISRAPYLKALSIWWNGTWRNGGGLFDGNNKFYLNRPPEYIAVTIPGVQSEQFQELPATKELRDFGWGKQGECPMVYQPRLERDGWHLVHEYGGGWVYLKDLPRGWKLEKSFVYNNFLRDKPGKGVYYETHRLLKPSGEVAVDATEWEWADFDGYRGRVVYAFMGAIYAIDINTLESKMLYDFNKMKFERIIAPY